jgi:hypothetical protein
VKSSGKVHVYGRVKTLYTAKLLYARRFKLGSSLASSPGTNHLVALSKALVGQDVDKARKGESVIDGVFSVDAHSPEANQLSLNDKSSGELIFVLSFPNSR